MSGLECTEKSFFDIMTNNRIDSDFYQHKYLQNELAILRFRTFKIGERYFVTDGEHGSVEYFPSGIKYLTAENIKKGFIEISNVRYVNNEVHIRNKRASVDEGDILLSIKATLGEAAVAENWLPPCNMNRDVAILKPIDNRMNISEYLSLFLMSKYGYSQSQRGGSGGVQRMITLERLREFQVPEMSKEFTMRLKRNYREFLSILQQSRAFYREAETTLLHALGLENWQAPEPLSYVRDSREAFAAGRLDAEYFYPAKVKALANLTALSDYAVSDFFMPIRELWQPENGSPSELIRNYDLTDALNPFLESNKTLVERGQIASTKKIIAAGDLVVSRLRSYLREIALVLPGNTALAVASTEFIVLRPRSKCQLPVEALLIYLRSQLPQIVFKWSQDGSNHPRFDEKELLNLPVPQILISNATEYVDAVQSMIKKRKYATKILESAKRAVEIAIEESEASAEKWLREVTARVG
jgi:restriction endonuclease S subunit